MRNTRRQFISKLFATVGILGFLLADSKRAHACLYGTWRLKCPNCGQVDTVKDGTCQHPCEKCGTQVFSGDDVTVVCPNGHPWKITTGHPASDSYICPTCKADCNTGPHAGTGAPRRDHDGPHHDPN